MNLSNGIGTLPRLSDTVSPAAPAAQAGNGSQIKANAAALPGSQQGPPAGDQAVISSASELLTAALNASDVRLEKIQPLQAAIAAGTYQVSASDVAEKLIGTLLQ